MKIEVFGRGELQPVMGDSSKFLKKTVAPIAKLYLLRVRVGKRPFRNRSETRNCWAHYGHRLSLGLTRIQGINCLNCLGDSRLFRRMKLAPFVGWWFRRRIRQTRPCNFS